MHWTDPEFTDIRKEVERDGIAGDCGPLSDGEKVLCIITAVLCGLYLLTLGS